MAASGWTGCWRPCPGTGGPVAVPAARPGRAAADPAGVAGARSAARLPAALGPGRARVLHAVRQYPLDLRAAFATAAGAGAGRLDGGPCADAGLARPVAGGADAADPARGADAGRAVARAARTLQDRKAAGGPGLRAHAARRAAGLRGQQAVLGALLFAGRGRPASHGCRGGGAACRGRRAPLPGGRKNRLPALRDTLAGWRLLPLYASRRYVLLQVESGAVAARDDAAREAPAAIAATGLAANPPSPAP